MYAFLSHTSACEVLRSLDSTKALHAWPQSARPLPLSGSCVSNQCSFKEIERRVDLPGLGVQSMPVDLLVPRQAMRSRGKRAHFHVWSGPVPAGSMVRVADDVLVSGPELVVAQFCGAQAKLSELLERHAQAVRAEMDTIGSLGLDCAPVIDEPRVRDSIERLVAATLIACEFAGTYRLGVGGRGTSYHRPPLMDASSLAAVIAAMQGTANKTRAAEVSGLFYEGSASPMETGLALMLTLPVHVGGLGLPRAELNAPVDVSAYRGLLTDRDEVSPDLQWRTGHVALEYDSAEFHERRGTRQAEEDARRANILTCCGYRVMRVTPGVIRTVRDVELLARQIAQLLGIELARPTDIHALRRARLFELLMMR